jgi:short-subunit dehydrogenase
MQNRYVLLGASRGLGWAVYQELLRQAPKASFLLSSRKIDARAGEVSSQTTLLKQDFSQTPVKDGFLQQLCEFAPTHLIYLAGGGPYGNFGEKKWSDHQWALKTTFLYPAELLHHIVSERSKWGALRQVICVGSSIAESQPDPKASSYAAAKHALKGLIGTIDCEGSWVPVRLFSPGYMQTDLLPAHSEPRQKQIAENPLDVAKKLIAMIEKSD